MNANKSRKETKIVYCGLQSQGLFSCRNSDSGVRAVIRVGKINPEQYYLGKKLCTGEIIKPFDMERHVYSCAGVFVLLRNGP